jgi:acetylornithine/LysW-gamma-L-lysine aminotransferase
VSEYDIINFENRLMANVFAKRPVVITRGKGALVWDIKGKEYIDCMGSYGVALLGHSHPKVVEAVCKQAETLISCHASLYNSKRTEFLQKLMSITPTGLNKAFLSNSGAESVECALKLARKFTGKPEIIAVMGGYHGKTMGALSATWDKKYRQPFQPLVPEFKHVPPDNLEKLADAITDKTAAVLLEPIRGEGGVRVPPDGFLQGVRELCDEKNVLLILDEVQTSFGLKIGEHSSTFSGSPLVCAAACAAIDVLVKDKLADRAATLGGYFKEKLEELQAKYNIVKEVRGLGLMLGMEFRYEVRNIILKTMDRGVLVLDAGRNVLRFLPPLVIEKEQIDKTILVLDEVIGEEEK